MVADIDDSDRNAEDASACHLMPTDETAAKGGGLSEDRTDLFIPDSDAYGPMRSDFEDGKEVYVMVQKAMGIEKVMPMYRAKEV